VILIVIYITHLCCILPLNSCWSSTQIRVIHLLCKYLCFTWNSSSLWRWLWSIRPFGLNYKESHKIGQYSSVIHTSQIPHCWRNIHHKARSTQSFSPFENFKGEKYLVGQRKWHTPITPRAAFKGWGGLHLGSPPLKSKFKKHIFCR
jgi:hypothetical protein